MSYIDTHVHLDQEEFDADRDDVVDRFRRAGGEAMLSVGISAASSRATLELAETHPEIFAAVGIQPNCAAEAAPDDWDRIVAMVDHPRVVALGETGLDRHWDFTPLDVQRDYFDRHLRLARRHDLPVVIHCREAEAEVLAMLREAVGRGPLRGVLHAFSGDAAFAAQCLELGLDVSFAGMVTYRNKKFQPLRQVAASIPDDRLLIETDSPYLVPHPLRGKQRRNEPAWVVHTAECLAELRGVTLEELSAQTTANARRLFRFP
ncbi:MAG TPA: TatD family hydrolase [Thermoguttaceae bacterium]|nr:TatD family hydrolase [Thermoguttaceae bacterium]